MKLKLTLLTAGVALGAALFAQSASALTFTDADNVTITSTGGAPTGPYTIDFDNVAAGTNGGAANIGTLSLGNGASVTGNFQVANGTTPNVAAAPYMDTTNYLSVPVNGPSGTATLNFGQNVTDLSFYWGSIDAYNSVGLINAQGAVFDTITGGEVTTQDNGGQTGTASNRTIGIALAQGQTLSGLKFTSGSYALETDDYSFQSAAPEPAAWLLMIAGVGVVGYSLRRKSQDRVCAVAA